MKKVEMVYNEVYDAIMSLRTLAIAHAQSAELCPARADKITEDLILLWDALDEARKRLRRAREAMLANEMAGE